MKRRNKIIAAPTSTPVPAERLEAELWRGRQAEAVRRADALARRRAQAGHTRAVADVDEDARRAELDRVEREETASDNAELARMYRRARSAGERIRIKSAMARSGEVRALRLEQLRALNLKVLVPVLLGFAAWSTTGVHHGAARLMAVGHNAYGDPMWWALWVLEPVLIGAVVWVTIVRARLAASGGQIAAKAVQLAAGCLSVSVALNLAAGAHAVHGPHKFAQVCAVAAAMLAHVVGPAGAAATAHLIGLVDDSIAEADPWTQNGQPVPLLAEMDLKLTPGAIPAACATALTEAETDAEALDAEFGAGRPAPEASGQELFTDKALAAWLDGGDPPAEGPAPIGSAPDGDGPQGAAKPVPAGESPIGPRGRIVTDQPAGDSPGGGDGSGGRVVPPGVESATAARRAAGEQTRARIAAYMAAHPTATKAEIAAGLGLHPDTVKRYRRDIRRATGTEMEAE